MENQLDVEKTNKFFKNHVLRRLICDRHVYDKLTGQRTRMASSLEEFEMVVRSIEATPKIVRV